MLIPRYELIRVDHRSNQKRGGIYCLYLSQRFSPNKSKQYKLFEGMPKFQSEHIWETVNITLIYRSPSQSRVEFDTFLSNFELLLDYIAKS